MKANFWVLILSFCMAGTAEAQQSAFPTATNMPVINNAAKIAELRAKAEKGEAAAQSELGLMYDLGQGVTQDYAEAVKWLRKAADQGSAQAQYNLGVCYFRGHGVLEDYAEAVKWYRKAAVQSDPMAQYNLGVCCFQGQGVAQDYTEAVKWYRKAAEQDGLAAEYNLGLCYHNGQGVAQDYAEAAKWFRKAAEQGDAAAQYDLGYMYGGGQGVPQDYIEAYKWYNLAAAQNETNAIRNRDIVASSMTALQIIEGQRLSREFIVRKEGGPANRADNTPLFFASEDHKDATELLRQHGAQETQISDASEIQPPTNDVVELSSVTGRVLTLDSQELQILTETNSNISTRIALEDLRDSDYEKLLENKVAYSALTGFGWFGTQQNAGAFESQMHSIWMNGNSLSQKIQTRLAILRYMNEYNYAVNDYSKAKYSFTQFKDKVEKSNEQKQRFSDFCMEKARQDADKQRRIDNGEVVVTHLSPLSGGLMWEARGWQGNSEEAQRQIETNNATLAAQENLANQLISKANKQIDEALSFFGSVGIGVTHSPPFSLIPSLSMRSEVDAERIKYRFANNISVPSTTISTNLESAPNQSDSQSVDGEVKILIQEADGGIDGAQFLLGLRYLEGQGVPKDNAKGIEYLKKAAAQGKIGAINKLKELGQTP
ncbi:MAG: tetratricopeptide repeat protein [Limisphaerales bacterium]